MTLDLPARRPFGPLAWALEEHGCVFTVLPATGLGGHVRVQLVFPDDEYLEKQCRRILQEWSMPTPAPESRGDNG
jgi:hypothetical protein